MNEWMRSGRVVKASDKPMPKSQQSWVQNPIPASSDTVESREMKQC